MDGGSSAKNARRRPVSLAELEAQITELAGQLNAAQYRWLTLIAEYDRRKGWADGKLPSCAHWLNFKCGLNLGAAREKVRVAHALSGLPKIAAAMARGELSYSKVRAVSRVACEATEETFLMIALHGTAHHVERLVSGYRRAQQAEELSREAQQHANRSVSYGYAEDGSLVLKARLPAVAGAMLIEALEAALERIPADGDLRQGGRRTHRSPMHAGAPMRSPTWRRASSPAQARALHRPPIAIRSWCTWTRRVCVSTRTAAARSSRDPPSPSRRHAGSPAMPACSASWRTSTGNRSMWDARRAPFPPPSAVHCEPAMPGAASPAAPISGMSMRTTSSTGPTAGRPSSPTL